MATSYDIQTYLLDRANIHDTVSKLTMNIDLKSYDGLVNEVYAPQVVIDYTSMFGGNPMETTGKEWVESLKPMMSGFDSTQHIVMNQVVDLPQPAKGVVRPDKCTVIAHVNGHMFLRAARGGPMMHNGGRYILDLVRLPELDQKGQNPWRISKHATLLSWEDGSTDVMNAVTSIGH